MQTKLILMSATLNADKLMSYYMWSYHPEEPMVRNATKYEVKSGAKHNVNVFYLDDLMKTGQFSDIKLLNDTLPVLSKENMSVCRQLIQIAIPKFEIKAKDYYLGAILIVSYSLIMFIIAYYFMYLV